MFKSLSLSSAGAILLAAGIGISGIGAFSSVPVSAQNDRENFPDITPDYWAYPFVRNLAEQGVIAGYPDGTFRAQQPVQRDEFAAMIRRAFNQDRIRQIPSGSTFNDVPKGYWAASPIEEAYETGFMRGYPGRRFYPEQQIPRVQAVVSLTSGLRMAYIRRQGTQTALTTNGSGRQRQKATRGLLFPVASAALVQPFIRLKPVIAAALPPATPKPEQRIQQTPGDPEALEFLRNYYKDADQIPEYAINDVAVATRDNMVVNYPDVRMLNPNQPINRGAAAALIHQALVRQGKLYPLSQKVEASRYVVSPQQNQGTQAAQ